MGKQSQQILIDLLGVSEKGVVKLALGIHGRLVDETPVDTGFAASNWVPAVGSPFIGIVGSPKSIDNSQQIRGLLEIAKWKFPSGAAFISNNVQYIQRLNQGYSPKAPAGYVESIIQSEVAKANREKLL